MMASVGVVRVEGRGFRTVSGHEMEFFSLKAVNDCRTFMVPVASPKGLRPLLPAADIAPLFEALDGSPGVIDSQWNRRFRDFSDRFKTGLARDLMELIRDLTLLSRKKPLAMGEKSILDKSLAAVSYEIALVEGTDAETVKARILDVLSKNKASPRHGRIPIEPAVRAKASLKFS
jgi:CarD family transcriptional regulator